MNRRRFLTTTSAATAAIGTGLLASESLLAQDMAKSRVASITSDIVQPAAGRLVKAKVQEMIDAAVTAVTGEEPQKSWDSLFASDDVVAIKVNASAGPALSTNKVIVDCIVDRLAGLGISKDNIVVYDRTDGALEACGYVTNSGIGLKCGGVEGHWDKKIVKAGAYSGHLPVILGFCSAIINVPILKDAPPGVTIAMKNHFGTISNPSECHKNLCDPYIADVNTLSGIRDRERLIICDATSACFEGGPYADPRYIWRPNTILGAIDPVALDTIGAQMIDEKRVEQNFPTLEAAGRPAKQLASAAERGVGTNDLASIDVIERIL